jgi:hypothetical protein
LTARVNARARTREDRAGDPLDGLVNLFDLGIVLAVAFLLAALSSIDLAPTVLQQNETNNTNSAQAVPSDSVIQKPGEEAATIELQPGETVVGQGEPVGTVYRLSDGRTVIVRPESEAPVPGEEPSDGGAGGTSPGNSGSGSTTAPDSTTTTPGGSTAPDSPTTTTTPQPSTGAP